MAAWSDIGASGVTGVLASLGSRLIRWPGGSTADAYHWKNNSASCGGYVNGGSTIDKLMKVVPAGTEVAITVNYGSNLDCTAGGDPAEAAAWVAHNASNGYNIHHYTIGNEVYGGWEEDMHAKPHDAQTYAAAVGTASSGGYYQQMKAMDPTAQIGVVVGGGTDWDKTVLSKAQFDFVEIHWYAWSPGNESDMGLLTAGPTGVSGNVAYLRQALVAAGKPADTPIFFGEMNSVYASPGKQSLSVVNGLFEGLVFGEILNAGVPMAAWWMGLGTGCEPGSDSTQVASTLYGWQGAGTYSMASNGYRAGDCGAGSPAIPFGTLFPTGYAHQLVSQFATPGGNVLATSIDPTLSTMRAYATAQGSSYSLLLFNLDSSAVRHVTVGLANAGKATFDGTLTIYGKAQYDDSKNNVWTPPVVQSLGRVTLPVAVDMPAWSMGVLRLQ